jgi:hypothetical protein
MRLKVRFKILNLTFLFLHPLRNSKITLFRNGKIINYAFDKEKFDLDLPDYVIQAGEAFFEGIPDSYRIGVRFILL